MQDNMPQGRDERMKPLRDYNWWPDSWGPGVNPGQVRLKGIFKGCRLSRSGLILMADYHGEIVQAIVQRQPDLNLEKVRDLLLPHCNKRMQEVDSLEFECDSPPNRHP
jgi:hypothetical protein